MRNAVAEPSSSRPRPRAGASACARRAVLGLLLGAFALGLLVPVAGAASAKRIIAVLNAQRAKNGIPAGIVENPAWSAACQAHNAYQKRNHTFGHEEVASGAGYSSQGNLIAQTSVLAQGVYWGTKNPYDNAPYHLFDLLNPRISSTGAADSEGFGCVEIELGTLRAAPSAVRAYTYPGNRRTGIAVSQRANEQPSTPAQALGLGTRKTGPNMFVYFDGPWTNGSRAQITSASLSSSKGSVALRWLDNTTSNLLAPTGAILVPASPLRAGTGYRVRVQGSVSGVVPGTSIEEALPACSEQPGGGVSCGQPPATACVQDFATQLAVCGLSRTWAVTESFSFRTAKSGPASH